MSIYNHKEIDKKWQKRWSEEGIFSVSNKKSEKQKKYVLDMFPYPSGAGLHVGHPEGYTATDIYSRYLRMKGYDVLHPMGWDAFGLPAENYAIKNGINPNDSTQKNISTFRRQIQSLGFSYDWSREINTSSKDYYKWTQWLFLKFYRAGLAYKAKAPVNWCESCRTVLANEQVVSGKCERCSSLVVQKDLEQWFFKITKYAEPLLAHLEDLDWPEPIKTMQRNWIGKSSGARIDFEILNSELKIEIFTTRPDTIFGATYMVLSPEHELVLELKDRIKNWEEVSRYMEYSASKSALERTDLNKDKTGVVLDGVFAINPLNKKQVQVWIADYVLASYGTGAIMAVPAHDERDFEFATKYGIEIVRVIENSEETPSKSPGNLINSSEFDGMSSEDAKNKIIEKAGGSEAVQYKLRDWLISRQRYWGAPIPIIYCEDCGEIPVAEDCLPVELPSDVDFLPNGASPLANHSSFKNVFCPKCGKSARREYDTMDTFVDSSWYFLRFCDPLNEKEFASSDSLKKWMKVDMYVGGAEHAVLHLLYARFFCMALCDLGLLDFEEPFLRLKNQGLILGPDGQKMSKSKGNVINPDEVVENLGADTVRMYEMFMGPLEDSKPWDTSGIIGVRRFLERAHFVREIVLEKYSSKDSENKMRKELNKLVDKIGKDIESFSFNTCVSQFMIFVNFAISIGEISKDHFETFLKVLNPFAPHLTNEIWESLGNKDLIEKENWPETDVLMLLEEDCVYSVSVNGKRRAEIKISKSAPQKEVEKEALSIPLVQKYISDKKISKVIFVSGKLINFVLEK